MVKPLSTAWTQGLTGKDKDDFELIVRNSVRLFTRLKEILEEQEQSLQNLSYSLSDFEDPNWAQKQAFRNGQLSRLKSIKELLPF